MCFSIASRCYFDGQEIKTQAIFNTIAGSADILIGAAILIIGILGITGVIPMGAIAGWCIASFGIASLIIGLFSIIPAIYAGTTNRPLGC